MNPQAPTDMHKPRSAVVAELALTSATLALGYIAFGAVTMLIFTAGFLGGFLIWLAVPSRGECSDIKSPYWMAMLLFLIHRVEEKQFGFFKLLAETTGVPTPEVTSVPVLLLVGISVGAWLLVPILMKRRSSFGHYLAWTFFASMGLTELAHFLVFPFLAGLTYSYVPGMASVVLLAPLAWFGMWRLASGRHRQRQLNNGSTKEVS